MSEKIWSLGVTQNRELSWLQFNARVLEEAEDETVPLLERLNSVTFTDRSSDCRQLLR